MKYNNRKKSNYATNIFDFVKENINIIDLISRDEELKHTRNGYRGGHYAVHESESGNCLYVNETDGWFYCHHCGAGGSVIDSSPTKSPFWKGSSRKIG